MIDGHRSGQLVPAPPTARSDLALPVEAPNVDGLLSEASEKRTAFPRPPIRMEVNFGRRVAFALFSLLVLAGGIAVSAGAMFLLPFEYRPDLLIIGPLLAVGFLLAEQLTIDVDVKRTGWTISFTEIPLILGLLIAPFEVVLAANLLAGLCAQVGRRAATHVAYNAGVMCLEVAVPFLVASTFSTHVFAVPGWFAPAVGALTCSLISCGFGLVAVVVRGDRMRLMAGVRLAARTLAIGLLNVSVGLVGFEVATSTPWGWALVLLVGAAVVLLYRAYSGLLREQRDLEALSDVSLSVARTADTVRGPTTSERESDAGRILEWEFVAERIREQLNATRVVLRVWQGGDSAISTLVAGQPLPESPSKSDASSEDTAVASEGDNEPLPSTVDSLAEGDALLQLPGNHVRLFRVLEASDDVRRALRTRGAYEALVVPLRGAHQLLGSVEVHDRVSRWRGFGKADIRLVHTLASHLATAMDNRRLLGRLRHDAYHDPLTGLLNRAGFRAMAADALQAGELAAIVRVDLDLSSSVSEAIGYVWSDRILADAGRRLREKLGHGVPLARLESHSFAVLLDAELLKNSTESAFLECVGGAAGQKLVVDLVNGHEPALVQERESAGAKKSPLDENSTLIEKIAEQLQAAIAEPYPLDRLVVEASGVAGYVGVSPGSVARDNDIDTLLQHADVAVQAARTDEDRVRGYAPAMGQVFLRRFQLVTQFRQALDSGQVEVHYQPKVALPGRHVVGAEALVRWRHPEYGQLSPDEFIPIVEATGLVDVLTTFVLDRALIKVRDWLDRGLRMSVAVNLSVRNLADESFPDRVVEAFQRHDVPSELLTFELTESSVMESPERCLPVLRRLHAMGVVLAVDDFGTGYSSLAYLRQLPVDEVKIDKSFVLGMGTDLADMAVVRTIVELGHSLHLTVVAEGVEDDAARDQLIGMNCDVAQGYLISRPLSEERFEAWLAARTRKRKHEPLLTLLG